LSQYLAFDAQKVSYVTETIDEIDQAGDQSSDTAAVWYNLEDAWLMV